MIFSILALGYVIVYFHRLCPAVLAVDMMADLKAGGTLIGLLGSAYFYPYAFMQLPAGLLSDSWGARKSITVFLGVAFAGAVLMGTATSAFWAIFGRALTGFGVSILFVPTMKVMAEWFTAKEFAVMSGFLIAAGGIGSLSSSLPLAWLSAWIGWRMSFTVVGIATLGIAGLVWFFVKDRPSDMGLPSPLQDAHLNTPVVKLWDGAAKVLSDPRFWPLAIWFFFDAAVFFTFGGLWGGPYLMHVYGLTKPEAGSILSMLSVGMILGSPGLSFLSNRVFGGRRPVLILSAVILIILTSILFLMTGSMTQFMLFMVFLGIGIFSSAIVAVGFTAAKELYPVSISGTAIGLINLFPFLGGALLQPFVGFVLEKTGSLNGMYTVEGYKKAMFIFLTCSIAAFTASLFIKETLEKQPGV